MRHQRLKPFFTVCTVTFGLTLSILTSTPARAEENVICTLKKPLKVRIAGTFQTVDAGAEVLVKVREPAWSTVQVSAGTGLTATGLLERYCRPLPPRPVGDAPTDAAPARPEPPTPTAKKPEPPKPTAKKPEPPKPTAKKSAPPSPDPVPVVVVDTGPVLGPPMTPAFFPGPLPPGVLPDPEPVTVVSSAAPETRPAIASAPETTPPETTPPETMPPAPAPNPTPDPTPDPTPALTAPATPAETPATTAATPPPPDDVDAAPGFRSPLWATATVGGVAGVALGVAGVAGLVNAVAWSGGRALAEGSSLQAPVEASALQATEETLRASQAVALGALATGVVVGIGAGVLVVFTDFGAEPDGEP